MKNTDPREKFAAAVDSMAVSPLSLRDRVFSAFLSFHSVQTQDLPDARAADLYEKLLADLNRFPAVGDEGNVQATLTRLSEEELGEVAQQIVDLRTYLEQFS